MTDRPEHRAALGPDELLSLPTNDLRELRMYYRHAIAEIEGRVARIKAERVDWERLIRPMNAAHRHYQVACGNINDIIKNRTSPEEHAGAVRELVLAARQMIHSEGEDEAWERLEAAVQAMPPIEGVS